MSMVIDRLREARDRPVRAWAESLGMHEQSWYSLCSGKRRLTPELLLRIVRRRPDLLPLIIEALPEADPGFAAIFASLLSAGRAKGEGARGAA